MAERTQAMKRILIAGACLLLLGAMACGGSSNGSGSKPTPTATSTPTATPTPTLPQRSGASAGFRAMGVL